ncbi:hypothetical protein KTI62_16215 [Acinetobacter schindleri]|uniref:hypothetical protein n=1 Tax=Acinetobacter schindleri TaxID=108981 RepID=UPI0021CDC4CA|nr:hypothetical protein [Acinetobacter schindleri]MCU4521671.1 hypothetical protein [Acinetobacter schindleri]
MHKESLNKIKGIWFKFNNQNKMPTITLEEIHSDCRAKGIEILAIEETKFGFNQSISAIKLTTLDNVAVLMPRYKLSEIKIYQNNILPFQKEENFWTQVDWFGRVKLEVRHKPPN